MILPSVSRTLCFAASTYHYPVFEDMAFEAQSVAWRSLASDYAHLLYPMCSSSDCVRGTCCSAASTNVLQVRSVIFFAGCPRLPGCDH